MWQSGSNLSEKGQSTAGSTMGSCGPAFVSKTVKQNANGKSGVLTCPSSSSLSFSPLSSFPFFSPPLSFLKAIFRAHAFAFSVHQELSTEILLAGEGFSQRKNIEQGWGQTLNWKYLPHPPLHMDPS